jgi:antitoxin YefM
MVFPLACQAVITTDLMPWRYIEMNILTFSEARASLKTAMDNVVTRLGGEHVVMLSLADFNSMEETMYLLSSAKNANRLMESIAQLRAGKARSRELISNDKQEIEEQAAS